MIKWYKFNNFHSFLDETFVDFTSGVKSSYSDIDFQLDKNTKISKVSAILGANGSGKSNLMKPLAFLRWFLTSSFKDIKQSDNIPLAVHCASTDVKTKIEVEFCIPAIFDEDKLDTIECRYYVELDNTRVYHEELKLKTSRLYSRVFSREYNSETKKYIFNLSKYISKDVDLIIDKTPRNASVIAFLSRFDEGEKFDEEQLSICDIVNIYFHNTETNLDLHGRYHEDIDRKILFTSEEYEKNLDLKNAVIDILKSYDMGLVDVRLIEKTIIDNNGQEKNKMLPYGVHIHNGEEFMIPFHHESSGTKAAYCTLFSLASILKYGSVAFLDELDNDLHPHLLIEIIELFRNSETNKHNAQLIMSTHTPEVLKHLKKHHCFIVEKENSLSSVWRLDEIDGLRSQDNLYVKYMTGAIGGVPNIG